MHGAPSVSHPVGRSRFAARACACACLLAAIGLIAWALQVAASPAQLFGSACVLAAVCAISSRAWLLSPQGLLAWDGEGWQWGAAPPAERGMPEPIIDLQQVVLLRWRPEAGPVRWLWAEMRAQPATWADLRRALYSRVPP